MEKSDNGKFADLCIINPTKNIKIRISCNENLFSDTHFITGPLPFLDSWWSAMASNWAIPTQSGVYCIKTWCQLESVHYDSELKGISLSVCSSFSSFLGGIMHGMLRKPFNQIRSYDYLRKHLPYSYSDEVGFQDPTIRIRIAYPAPHWGGASEPPPPPVVFYE